jgi:hypothetical protein
MGKRGGEPDLPDYILVKKFYPSRRNKEKRMKRIWQLHSLAQSGANMTNMDVEDDDGSSGRKKKSGKDRQSRRVRDVLAREQVDYEHFLQDLEEDPELRSRINLYSKPAMKKTLENSVAIDKDSDEDDEDFPEIQLNELLDGLTLTAARTAHNNNDKSNMDEVSNALHNDAGDVTAGSTTFNLANVTTLPPTYTLNENAEVVDVNSNDDDDL